MRIALGQISSIRDKMANLDKVRHVVQEAAEEGAELVVFPEATMQGFGTGRLDSQAEPLDGEFVTALRELAEGYNLALVAGVFTPADTVERDGKTINRITNTLVACLPDGSLFTYDKIHTYDAFGFAESDTVAAGKELSTFLYKGVRFGLATCYDVRFPQQFRALARRGAQAILLPASWAMGKGKLEQWRLLTRARALDSTSVIVAVGQALPLDERTAAAPSGIGHSGVLAPDGTTIAELGEQATLAVYDVDLEEQVAKMRTSLPVLDYPENYL